MEKGGADVSKLELKYYADNYRGVHSNICFRKGETMMFVPSSRILTMDDVTDSPIG